MVGPMDDRHGERDLQRLKWIGVILPVAFIWFFEVLRLTVLDKAYEADTAHLVAALLMGGAVVLFALAMSHFIDRTQRRIVGHNKDLTLTHSVTSAVRGGLGLEQMLGAALDRMMAQTGALAGIVRVRGSEGEVTTLRQPTVLPGGLEWLAPLLDEMPSAPLLEPAFSTRPALDTLLLDLPLARAEATLGSLRLVFHPPVPPDVSTSALIDVAGEIATSIQLNGVVADLRRRERELAALNDVAIHLTGRAELRDMLDTINRYARELLAADRAVVCLADVRESNRAPNLVDRLALVDDGTVCLLAHPAVAGDHPRNPLCPIAMATPGTSWAARPLRGPDGLLGELCVVRDAGAPFRPSERALLAALADLAAVAVRTARLHEAEQQYAILAERDRIARELHDSMAQVLGVIHLRLRALESQAGASAGGAMRPELAELADVADEAFRDVREAILGLRESIPSEGGLEGALREYLRKFSRQTGIQANLAVDGAARSALSPKSEVQLLRVVQEALTNVRKHSGAHRAVVRLDCRGDVPVLAIEDDGAGFDPARLSQSFESGFGLASMRERVEAIGGTLDVHTAPGEGTRVVVRLQAEGSRVAPTTAPAGAAR